MRFFVLLYIYIYLPSLLPIIFPSSNDTPLSFNSLFVNNLTLYCLPISSLSFPHLRQRERKKEKCKTALLLLHFPFSRETYISLSLSSLHVFLLLIFPYTTSTPLFPLLLHFISLLSRQFFPEVIPDKRIPGDNKAASKKKKNHFRSFQLAESRMHFFFLPFPFFLFLLPEGRKKVS